MQLTFPFIACSPRRFRAQRFAIIISSAFFVWCSAWQLLFAAPVNAQSDVETSLAQAREQEKAGEYAAYVGDEWRPSSRVSIDWSVDLEAGRFKLVWTESGGPVVVEPMKKSFGSRFIEQALPGQLQGEARMLFEPAGLVCDVNIPLSSLQEPVIALR